MAFLWEENLAGSLTPEQAITHAEALVTAALCPALPDLTRQRWTVEYRARNVPRGLGVPLYGARRLGPEVLGRWPITGLALVAEGGRDVTADCTFDTFSIRRDALLPEWGALSVVTASFYTGWDGDQLPRAIRTAMELTARGLLTGPEYGVVLERLGDVTTQYVEAPAALPASALALLAPYRYRPVGA